jgi:CRISPR system Cascade subunit CasC
MFIQLHALTSYPAALLNRDDVGFAKRIPFGGATRTRVSSQCLKRHWRTFEGEHSLIELGVPGSVRSRLSFERFVLEPLVKDGIDPALARAVVEELMIAVLGESAKAKKAKEAPAEGQTPAAAKGKKGKAAQAQLAIRTDDTSRGEEGPSDEQPPAAKEQPEPQAELQLRTGQVTVLGRPELDFLLSEARQVCAQCSDPKKAKDAVKARLGKEARKNLEALRHAAGLDAALFGRMVTSDILARGDAAIHVAHAFTVHEETSETDYFSALDDLLKDREEETLGSGHIGNAELTSGLYYLYVVLDLPLLVSNLEGCKRQDWKAADRTLAAGVAERMLWLFATVSPGAKLGSTAPHGYAQAVLAEVGKAQPRSLANAFLKPVAQRPDLLAHAYQSLATHVADLDGMYGKAGERAWAGMGPKAALASALGPEAAGGLAGLASWLSAQVRAK